MFDGKLGGTETWLAVRPWKATPEREASNRDPETALEEPGAAGPFNRRGRRRLFKRRNGSLLKLARSTRPRCEPTAANSLRACNQNAPFRMNALRGAPITRGSREVHSQNFWRSRIICSADPAMAPGLRKNRKWKVTCSISYS